MLGRFWAVCCMKTVVVLAEVSRRRRRAFTLVEVVVSMAIAALAFSGIIYGYTATSDQAEWSSYSLAAQSLAMQGVEQARSAKWDPHAWPAVDELGVTNFTQVEELDVPVAGGRLVLATNYISVSQVSSIPPMRQLRSEHPILGVRLREIE